MKLRNKKTGEIQTCDMVVILDERIDGEIASLNRHTFIFRSIEQFNDEYEAYTPKEPLIKDEATAKLVGSWARHWGIEEIRVAVGGGIAELSGWSRTSRVWQEIEILGESISVELEENKCYPIAELCGEEEAPEPIEPTFIDLDERIKEKEEE